MQPALCIASSDALAESLDAIAPAEFVTVDTEFMRESTYHPVLCLVQLATRERCLLIDPLAIGSLEMLWRFLADPHRLKILHAGRQDIEVMLLAMRGLDLPLPAPIFDTQIAAALLGLPAQIGYGNLVSERLGHSLTKGQARTDWARRPLSTEQLEYAADDVRYLIPLYDDLRTALQEEGKLAWLAEETRELEDPGLYRTEPQDAWKRLKGLDRMQPGQRAVAKQLAGWRETRAIASDKPRGWILSDDVVRGIAERLPETVDQLEQVREIPPGVVRKRGDEIIALVKQARQDSADEGPAFAPSRPDPAQVALVTKLIGIVRTQAAMLRIAPELLATRRDVESLVFSSRADRLLSGWRRAAIGDLLVERSELAIGR